MSCDCISTRITNFTTGEGCGALTSLPVIISDCCHPCCHHCCHPCCHPEPKPHCEGLDNALAYAVEEQCVPAGKKVNFSGSKVNSEDGNIVFEGTNGFCVTCGTYLLTFVADVRVQCGADASEISAQIMTSSGAVANAVTEVGSMESTSKTRLVLNTILSVDKATEISVINSSKKDDYFTNASFSVVKLA